MAYVFHLIILCIKFILFLLDFDMALSVREHKHTDSLDPKDIYNDFKSPFEGREGARDILHFTNSRSLGSTPSSELVRFVDYARDTQRYILHNEANSDFVKLFLRDENVTQGQIPNMESKHVWKVFNSISVARSLAESELDRRTK